MSHELILEHYSLNYERLVKRTTNRVPNKSFHLAEECVQEAYLRAIKYFKTYDHKRDPFNKWFEGILRNAVNDCCAIERDRGVSKELDDEDGVDLRPKKWEKTSAVLILRDLKNNKEKQVLSMFLLYGFKTKDIAECVGLSHDNVRQIIFRFRKRMNEIFSTNVP